ncbi:hypothetical protein [Teichococcus aerofrigidensis]
MPFDPRGLSPLSSTGSFTLWLYVTTDTRAAILAQGYFASAADRLLPGHILVAQAADSLNFLPVQSSGRVGNGVVLDASAAPLRLAASSALGLAFSLPPVDAATRSVALDAVPAGLYIGRGFAVSARVGGPIAALEFSILDASGGVVAGPVTSSVANGAASASFTAPAPGTGYRIRVRDPLEPLATHTSASFVVTEPFALLTETGASISGESGGELLL